MKNKLNKVFSKITSCLLSMLMIVTCISVSTVVAEDSASDPTVITETTEQTSEVTTVSNEITGTEETQATTEQPAEEVKSEEPAAQVAETAADTQSEGTETTKVDETPKTEETTTPEQTTADTSNEEDKEDADVDTYAVVTADAGLATKEETPANDEIATVDEDVEETTDLNNMSSDELFNYLMSISAEEMEALYDLYDIDALTANFTEEQGNLLTAHFGGGEENVEEANLFWDELPEVTISIGETANINWTKSDYNRYYSDFKDVATVDKDGNVVGVREGTTTITHQYKNKQEKCKVTVKLPETLKVYVYVNGSGYSTEALEVLGIDPNTRDANGYFPVGEIELSSSYLNGKNYKTAGSALINSSSDWQKLLNSLGSLNTSTLTGKYAANQNNTISDYLSNAVEDINKSWGSQCTALFRWNGDVSYGFDDQSVMFHLDLRFNTSVITYKTGNNGIETGSAKDGNVVGTRTFISGTTAKEPSDMSFIPEGYELAGYYTDPNFKNEWIPETTTVTKGMTIYVKLVKKGQTAIEYVASEGGSVTISREDFYTEDGSPKGSTANENEGYVFEGWYSDEACTNKVSDNETLVPSGTWEAGKVYTYYAKFELDKDTFTVDALNDVKYNGAEQKQVPVIKNSKGEVADNSNFDITYSKDTTNVGTVTVTVTPKADSKFTGEVTTSYNITKRSVTINAVAAKKVYGAKDPDFTYELAEGSDSIIGTDLGAITVSRTSINENAGVYENDLVVNYTTNTNYEVKTNPANFEITAADGLEVGTLSDITYDGKEHKLVPTVQYKGKDLTLGTDYEISYNKDADFKNANTITVTVKGIGNYSGEVTKTYSILQRNVVINAKQAKKTYGDSDPKFGYKIAKDCDGLVNKNDLGKITVSRVSTNENAGTYENDLVVSYAENKNYNVTTNPADFVIEKAGGLKITVKDAEKEYDGIALKVEASSNKEGTTILYSIDNGKTWSKDAPSITDAGKLTVKVKATNPNYKDATASYELKVTQREVTIKSNSDNKTYDGTPLTNKNYKITKGSFVKGEDVTIKTTGTITNVGKVDNTIEVTYGDNCKASNYKVTLKAGTLEVKAADFKVKNLTNVNYNGQEQKQEVVITDKNGNELSHDLFEIKYSGDTTNAGKVTVTVKAKKNTNYTGTKTESYDIEKLTLTVKTESASKTYDGSALTAGGTIEGLVNNETVTFTVTGSQTNVGTSKNTYEIKWNGTAKKDNYIIKDTCGKLTVNAAEFTVEDLENVKYDGTTQKLLPVVKSGDKVLTNKKNYTLSYSGDTKNAGTVTVTVKGKGNYTGTVTKTYEITKRDVTVTSADASKVYDGKALANSEVTITGDGFVKGEASAKATGTITNVGEAKNTIEITYGKNYKADNYNIVINEGGLVVTKKSVTVTADNKEKTYGANDPDLTATVKGLVEGDSLNYSLSREEGEDAGEYVISVELPDNPNYEVEATSGYLTINPAEATITVNSYEKTKGESDPTLGATVTGTVNGESLEYTLSREEGEDVGEYTITAKLGENKNYKVTVVDGKLTIKEASAPTPDNNNDNTSSCPTGTYWNEATQSCVTRGRVNPTPTPDNGGSDDSTPVTPDTPDTEPIDDDDTPEVNPTPVTPETIDDDDTPEKAKGSWALVNLLSVCVSFLLGIILLLSKNKKDDDEEEENNNDEANKTIRHKRWKVVAVVDAIAALIVFILTENMTLPMALVDKWTLLMLALVLVSVVSLLLGRKYHEDDSDEEAQNA